MVRKFFMVVLTLVLVTGVYAQSDADYDTKQNPDGTTISIIGFKSTVKDLNLSIPPTIFGRMVTIIETDAFAGKELNSVTIPDKVTRIAAGAFRDNKIARVTFGKDLQYIGERAFANNRITDLVFPTPNKLKFIGGSAFENNSILSLNLPNGITSIETGAFAKNPLVAVIIPQSLAKRSVSVSGQISNGIANGAFVAGIVGVTLPGGMDEGTLRGNLDEDFVGFWLGSKKVAGPYIKQGPYWSRATPTDRDRYISTQIEIRRSEVAKMAEERAKKEAEEKAAAEAEAKRLAAETAAQKKAEEDRFNQQLKASGYTAVIRDDGTIEITGYSVKAATVSIPATLGGKTVTRIGEGAFRDKVSKGEITSITLPVTLVEIGKNAFANLNDKGKKGKSKLASVTWGLGVKKIEESAFAENTSLATIKAGTSQGETTISPNAISVEFMIAWLSADKPKTYTKKGSKWE
jgi:hypothetical protein